MDNDLVQRGLKYIQKYLIEYAKKHLVEDMKDYPLLLETLDAYSKRVMLEASDAVAEGRLGDDPYEMDDFINSTVDQLGDSFLKDLVIIYIGSKLRPFPYDSYNSSSTSEKQAEEDPFAAFTSNPSGDKDLN